MSSTEPTPKPARARRARKDSGQSGNHGEATLGKKPVIVSPEQRRSMIAETAYLRAERRGFAAGDPTTDWLESEQEVDRLLSRSTD
jgi:hypothetical protein